jgi:uncharacterized protein YjbI with pentapeptide repeats
MKSKRRLTLWSRSAQLRSRARRRPRLFTAVLLALLAGVAVATLAWFVGGWLLGVKAGPIGAADLLRLALYVAAGVGGFVALVVAYRRQDDLEQARFVERFGTAAAQLGDPDPAVRLAGAYAMAGVADDAIGAKRQQCVDVLCAYLRLPYTAQTGASNQTGYTTTRPVGEENPTELRENFSYRLNDLEVRKTIVRIIANHLNGTHTSWSENNFDFSGATLSDADFAKCTFAGVTQFTGAIFSGENTWFDGATFSGKNTWFDGAIFRGKNTSFDGATFSGENTWFEGATFSGKNTSFDGAIFSGKNTSFDGATLSGKNTSFDGATLSGKNTSFGGATFSGENTWFDGATFSGKNTSFDGATLSGKDTSFDGATLSGENTWFDGATFSGKNTRFDGATFSGETTSFENPAVWDPPPHFDWDDDVDDKPANVLPTPWPPTVKKPAPPDARA